MDPSTDYGSSHPTTTTTPEALESWIDTLPNELISEILVAVASPGPRADEGQLLARVRFPLVAQSVCRRWWHIAQATPALWSTLHFDRWRRNDLARHMLQCGCAPLEIHLEYPSLESPKRQHSDFLLAHAEGICTLAIKGRNTTQVRELVGDCPSKFINLLDLSIRADTSNSDCAQLTLSTPRLRSLFLKHYSLDWTGLPVAACMEELHIIESRICSVDVKLFLATFMACPNLRILELNNQLLTGCRKAVLDGLQPLALERLEELTLRQFYRHELQKIFRLLRTPQARTLTVEGLTNEGWSEEEGVVIDPHELLDLEFPALETLVVDRLDVSAEIVMSLPQVNHLMYLCGPDTDDRVDIDIEFGNLLTHWVSLPNPVPLETLRTRGVRLHTLLPLVEDDKRKSFPSLRKISVGSHDAFSSSASSKEEFQTRAGLRKELAAVVELEIYQEKDADAGSPVFETWESWQASLGGED